MKKGLSKRWKIGWGVLFLSGWAAEAAWIFEVCGKYDCLIPNLTSPLALGAPPQARLFFKRPFGYRSKPLKSKRNLGRGKDHFEKGIRPFSFWFLFRKYKLTNYSVKWNKSPLVSSISQEDLYEKPISADFIHLLRFVTPVVPILYPQPFSLKPGSSRSISEHPNIHRHFHGNAHGYRNHYGQLCSSNYPILYRQSQFSPKSRPARRIIANGARHKPSLTFWFYRDFC